MKKETRELRVWWIPQVGKGDLFYIPVESVEEGAKILITLAAYDAFQYQHDLKSDYANSGGLEVLDAGEWIEWNYDDGEHFYENIDEYIENDMSEFSEELFNQTDIEE